jgi:hypothetical protein
MRCNHEAFTHVHAAGYSIQLGPSVCMAWLAYSRAVCISRSAKQVFVKRSMPDNLNATLAVLMLRAASAENTCLETHVLHCCLVVGQGSTLLSWVEWSDK